MAHIAILTIPARGHVLPTIDLVDELTRRGHRVTYLAPEGWTAAAEKHGARAVHYASTLRPTAGRPVSPGEFAAWLPFVLLNESETVLPQLRAALGGDVPDLLVADRTAYVTARVLSAGWKRPTVVLATSFAANEHWSIATATGQQTVLDPEHPAYRALSEKLGPHGLTVEEMTRAIADHTVVTVPREFQYRAETFGDEFTFTGPLLRTRLSHPRRRRPGTVYLSMGTAFTDRPEIARAVEGLDVTGPGDDQLDVLSEADVFVTHAGMGSVLEGLWYGVSLVCVPWSTEQRLVAERVEQLGLGRVVEPAGIRAALTGKPLGSSDFVRASPGAPAAADALERLL